MELLNANEELALEITTQAISQPMTREASTGTTALFWLTTSPDYIILLRKILTVNPQAF
ncbi:hypothetical protein [Candidatus Coxiella mudrowiae]|uniref:hypothetical protein n=1 Tax=Candidatus Coxiella mudrowiae TaxID=2054173 RepID=UPI0012FF0463|nr:hypothetical protein [Candidatus Coxiella mudrowiae]